MKRKLSIIFLSFMLILGMLPMTALASDTPFVPEAPINLTAELKQDENGMPYFELRVTIPESVKALNAKLLENSGYFEGKECLEIELAFDYKYGKYDWNEGPTQYWDTSTYVAHYLEDGYYTYQPFDSSTKFEDVDIKSETYSFRARFETLWGYTGDWTDKEIYSGYSNVVQIGSPAYWSTASTWARPELQKAVDAGLIPDILKGADMTKPITREEFAELSVLLYEQVTEKASEPVSPNPFKDTTNTQILKAYMLGITSGTSTTTFEPKILINREQCAAMLFRAIKAIKPDSNYSIEGVKDFPDQKHISSWAVEATKYMSKIGIISGDSNGNFMPKSTTTAQQAASYGMATREQAIALSLRTYEKFGE